MNDDIIFGDVLIDPPRFRPIALFHKLGAQKVYYKGDAKQVPETEEERALAQVAEKKWKYYQDTYRPLEDQYMKNVDKLDSEGSYDFVRGAAGSATSAAFGDAKEATAKKLTQAGINPNSGAFKSTLSDMSTKQGLSSADSMARSQTDQQDQHVKGVMNVAALGKGQSTTAQAGLSDVAGAAANEAWDDAREAHNDIAAGRSAAGTVFGVAGSMAADGLSDYAQQNRVNREAGYSFKGDPFGEV